MSWFKLRSPIIKCKGQLKGISRKPLHVHQLYLADESIYVDAIFKSRMLLKDSQRNAWIWTHASCTLKSCLPGRLPSPTGAAWIKSNRIGYGKEKDSHFRYFNSPSWIQIRATFRSKLWHSKVHVCAPTSNVLHEHGGEQNKQRRRSWVRIFVAFGARSSTIFAWTR